MSRLTILWLSKPLDWRESTACVERTQSMLQWLAGTAQRWSREIENNSSGYLRPYPRSPPRRRCLDLPTRRSRGAEGSQRSAAPRRQASSTSCKSQAPTAFSPAVKRSSSVAISSGRAHASGTGTISRAVRKTRWELKDHVLDDPDEKWKEDAGAGGPGAQLKGVALFVPRCIISV